MDRTTPPIVDHAKRAVVQEIKTRSFFSIFNIVLILAIMVVGWFLYKKFTQKFKQGAIRLPVPVSVADAVGAPVKVEEEDVPDAPADTKDD
jgi:positive regulator of sigma E activity